MAGRPLRRARQNGQVSEFIVTFSGIDAPVRYRVTDATPQAAVRTAVRSFSVTPKYEKVTVTQDGEVVWSARYNELGPDGSVLPILSSPRREPFETEPPSDPYTPFFWKNPSNRDDG